MRIYNLILMIGMMAVMIFAPIARGAVRLWSLTPVMMVVYSLLLTWGMRIVVSNKGYGVSGKAENAPIILFAILAATSFAFSVYKHDSLYTLVMLFAYIGLYFLVLNEFDHRMRKRLVWTAISIGSALSAYGLLQYCGVFKHGWWIPPDFLAATYVNHNHFAGYLEMVIPVAAAIIVDRQASTKNPRLKIILVASLALMGIAFVLTQSRGAWVSLGISLIVMLLIIAGRKGGIVRVAIIIALIVVMAISAIYFMGDMMASRLATLTSAAAGDDVSGGRFHIWKGALGMIRERPLTGFGIGDFDAGFYRYRPSGFNAKAVYAHNEYLHMAGEMGVFAPLLMLWLFIVVIREGLSKSGKSPYAFGCAIGMMSLALHALVDFNFHIPANMILFTIWAAIVVGERQ